MQIVAPLNDAYKHCKRFFLRYGWLVCLALIILILVGWMAYVIATPNKPSQSLAAKIPSELVSVKPTTTTTTLPPTTTTTTTPKPVVTTPKAPTTTQPINLPAGSHTGWMAQAGIPEGDWGYVDYIISHESGWNPANVSPSNCIGLGQNCPWNGVYFLPLACPNWQSDPVCQLRRFTEYASKYGGWAGSYYHWLGNGNW